MQEEDGLKSNQALILNGDRYPRRRSSNGPNTIKLNLNKTHYFEQRAYMFYEVSKLLGKVCELMEDPQLKSRLQEQFLLFFQFKGTSKILKQEIIGVLRYLRLNHIRQKKQRMATEHEGIMKKIPANTKYRPALHATVREINSMCFVHMVKDLLQND